MSAASASYALSVPGRPSPAAVRTRILARPELLVLLGLTSILNLWDLGRNGWANTYYSAAVRSMSTSWHDFLFASLDKTGLMTVDKPPLSLWVQALSVRVFGFHPLSILVPEAVMGIAAVGLVYDMARRRFGRGAGFIAGLVLALTPITVAVARHNNPDELLILCSVAALWCALRALETGRTRWLVLSGVCVGLGFETKMGVALMVVPGIAAAYAWLAPRGRLAAVRQLLAGGAAMITVAGAWPVLVMLTPAAERPWISGTSDNSIWSLIFGYNGLGRVAGQSGGPGGGAGGTLFGGPTGVFRLLQSGLGDQAGWLLGFSVVAGLGILALSRLRRRDPRTGWLILVGGAFATSAVVFSFAGGIFHPYYVSFLAPFAALLVGAGAGLMLAPAWGGVSERRSARIIGPLTITAGVVTELVVLGGLDGQLAWGAPLVLALGGGSAFLLAVDLVPRAAPLLVTAALLALLAPPAAWAAQTLGHAANGTFPAGGPASAGLSAGGGFGPPRGGGFGPARGATRAGRPGGGFAPPGAGGFMPPAGAFPGSRGMPLPLQRKALASGPGAGPGGFGASTASLTAAVRYARTHGGGAIAVSSQGSAAAEILSSNADVAGIGGFSGRESSVSAAWLAQEVRSGRVRWILADAQAGPRLPGDTRAGSQRAIIAVEKSCRAVTVGSAASGNVKMYDCLGYAAAIVRAASS